MRMRAAVFAVWLSLEFPGNSRAVCQLATGWQGQYSTTWCWAANIEYMAAYYSCFASQCAIANEFIYHATGLDTSIVFSGTGLAIAGSRWRAASTSTSWLPVPSLTRRR